MSALLGLSGCGLLPDKTDETAKWSAEKLYAEAREEMAGAHYEAAIKLFQRLEANYPFGTYATQAQMEIAYAHYKAQDQAEALAAVERFIKLHPNHPQVDYMYYLRGLINFNDRIGFLSVIYSQDPTERDPKATREAFAAFRALIDKFPNSKYAPDAIARLNYLINAMASVRSARGELLLSPRRLPRRRQPRPERRGRLRRRPGARRSAVHHGAQLRQARHAGACATTPSAC